MTANQRYKIYKKEAGPDALSFARWMSGQRSLNETGPEPTVGTTAVTDSLNKTINAIHKSAGEKTGLENKYILGIRSDVLIVVGLIGAGVGIYFMMKKKK